MKLEQQFLHWLQLMHEFSDRTRLGQKFSEIMQYRKKLSNLRAVVA
jgi:hypothetical protein